VLADIPGLIEGAAQGAGLGHDFLRHIQRTRVLVHLLDGLSEDPVADYSQINSELSLFDPNLGKKPQVVALNKIDQPEVQERLGEIEKKFKKLKVELMTISALARTNTRELLIRAYQKLEEAPPVEDPASAGEAPLPVYKPKEDPREFTITREGANEWRVSGVAIERAASMTYWQHDGSVRRFQKIMETIGVEEALRKAGVQEGDTVAIGDFELEWQD
jgi:GTP-binding protein